MSLPKVVRVQQNFDSSHITDIAKTVAQQMGKLGLEGRVKPGQNVAITGGSRGVANISAILRAVVDELRKLGARPFIIPAMGSHGGGTAEGQKLVLEQYGITEASMGAPIRATMETTPGGETTQGIQVRSRQPAVGCDPD